MEQRTTDMNNVASYVESEFLKVTFTDSAAKG